MDDDTGLVEKDQRGLRAVLELPVPDQLVSPKTVLTNEEIVALTDRSLEAYVKKDGVDSACFTKPEQVCDEQDDLLAKMKA
ncbi:hypothetical protein GGI21_002112, partial [Coemansia aciculifera]